MITAAQLKTLSGFTAAALTRALRVSGHKRAEVNTAEFLGITNAGQFCYSVTQNNKQGELEQTKVFLTLAADTVTAGY